MLATILLTDRASLDLLEIEGGWRRSFVARFWGTLQETADPTPQGDGTGFDDLLKDHRLVCIDESLLDPIDVDRVDRLPLERLRNNFIRKVAAQPRVRLAVIDGGAEEQERRISELEQRIRLEQRTREAEKVLTGAAAASIVVLVFLQPMGEGTRRRLDALPGEHPGVTRWYLMGDRLQPEVEGGKLAASFAVWPIAVARLLAVIANRPVSDWGSGKPRLFAWRTILWGTGDSDAWALELRSRLRSVLLPAKDPEPETVTDQRDLPELKLPVKLDGDPPDIRCRNFAWDQDPDDLHAGAFDSIADEVFVDALRESGRRSRASRALETGMGWDGGVRQRSENNWAEVQHEEHGGPIILRRLKDGRCWKRHGMAEMHESQRSRWADLVKTRRKLDVAREHHRDAAEEVSIARARHLSLWWRLAIAAAIVIFVGQLIASILLPLRPPGGPALPPLGNSFLGVPIEGDSVGFLVDRSGSMAGERIERLRSELERSVLGLKGGTPFCVIAYSTEHLVMKGGERGLVPANDTIGRDAVEWIKSLEAEGGTRPVEGLRTILAMRPQTLVFLTDGEFSDEDKEEVRKLVAGIDAKNPSTRIHTIALYQRSEEPFLKAVAEATGGEYRFIAWDPFAPYGFETVATIILTATVLGAAVGALVPWYLERRAGRRGTAVLRSSMGGLLWEFADATKKTRELMAGAVVVRRCEGENAEGDLQRAIAARAFGTVEEVLLGGRREASRKRGERGSDRLAREDQADFRRALDVPLLPDPGQVAPEVPEDTEEERKGQEQMLRDWAKFCAEQDPQKTGHLPTWAIERWFGGLVEDTVEKAIENRQERRGVLADSLCDRLKSTLVDASTVPFLSVRTRAANGRWPHSDLYLLRRTLSSADRVLAYVEGATNAARKITDVARIRDQGEVPALGFHAFGLVHQEVEIKLLVDGGDRADADARTAVEP